MTSHQRNSRRGVTLLLVLGLMTMFAMLVVTFMVVTTQALKTSQITAEMVVEYDGTLNTGPLSSASSMPDPLLNDALDRLLVGGLNTIIGPHGILENLYGHPVDAFGNSPLEGQFGTVSHNTSKDLLFADGVPFDFFADTQNTGSNGDGNKYYNGDLCGHVLTVKGTGISTDPNAELLVNTSTLVVQYNYTDGTINDALVLAPFKNVALSPAQQATALDGCDFIINSSAFGGTGPGYDDSATNARLTNGDGANFPWALRPNVLAPESGGAQSYKNYLQDNLVMTNPDYTAPDYMNMFLAWTDVHLSNGYYQVRRVIPSFHRPQLVNYWFSSINTAHDLRKIVLRPLRQDHPNFTGSNHAANVGVIADEIDFLINGPWDVDNDGDGVQDGIWLDLGFAPVTIDGRMYKRLYSFYVVDLDGRLNVNVHGDLENVTSGFDTVTLTTTDTANGSVAVRGAGSGAAEVRLDKGLQVVDGGLSADKLMASGNADRPGRYGKDGTPGDPNWSDTGLTDSVDLDDFTWNMGIWHGVYGDPESTFKGFGSIAPDFWGYAKMLFDPLGNRKFEAPTNYFAENPYLLNPYVDGTGDIDDNPFRFDDLEFLVRSVGDKNFMDVLSNTRLRELFAVDNHTDPQKFSKFRHFVTTRSSDIPVAGRAGLGGSKGLFECLMKICNNAKTDAEKLADLLPPELFRGERVSLDRIILLEAAFKKGGIGGIDDEELLRQKARFAQEIFYLMMVLCHDEIYNKNYNENPVFNKDAVIARIAQWSVNVVDFLDGDDIMTPLIFKIDPLGSPGSLYDFISSDFNTLYGGSLTSPGGGNRLIWGMEQPEMALTKTFATHNRRVADSKWGDKPGTLDTSGLDRDQLHKDACAGDATCNPKSTCQIHLKRMSKGCTSCGNANHVHDESFDQVMVPQGSLFLELYRVGNPGRKDFPKNNGTNYNNNLCAIESDENILDLGKKSGNDPIWRLAIGKATKKRPGASPESDKKEHDLFDAMINATDIAKYDFQPQQWSNDSGHQGDCKVELERFIWFGTDKPGHGQADGCSYWNFGSPDNNTSGDNVKLRPNEYLVIGPRVFTSFKSKPVIKEENATGGEGDVTEFGVPDGNTDEGINDYSVNLKKLFDKLGGSSDRCKFMIAAAESTNDNYCVLGGGLKEGIGVSVSEPLPSKYYPFPTTTTTDMKASTEMKDLMVAGSDYYDKYIGDDLCDEPLIEDNGSDLFDFDQGFGTLTRFKSIFLQRLADPNRAYHVVSNPYVTVDWNMIDLHVFNSEEDEGSDLDDSDDPGLEYDVNNGLYFSMRQWGYTATMNTDNRRPNIWDRSFDKTEITSDKAGLVAGKGEPKLENLEKDFALGQLNIEGASAQNKGGDYQGVPDEAFLHLPWNDGPLANTYELMMVPASSPSRFGFEFHESGKASTSWWQSAPSLGSEEMPISNEENDNTIGPYFNFFRQGTGTLELARLFDFVRVPSRFSGTIRGFYLDDDNVFKPVYEMREPGRINLNTANEAAWEALRSQSDPAGNSQVRYEELLKVRGFDPTAAYPPPVTNHKPFRSTQGGALVPLNGLVQSGGGATVLRNDSAGTKPFFKPFEPTGNGKVNPFTLLENVMRRSDMVTTRSNTFAVWVTVGYFEVQQYANYAAFSVDHSSLSHVTAANFGAIYPGGYVLGDEKGIGDGSVTRHRGFYIIDRTVPVGFRRDDTSLNSRDVIIHSQRLD